jgi:hypothetical protein
MSEAFMGSGVDVLGMDAPANREFYLGTEGAPGGTVERRA